jgi:hypothetical protein
MVSRWWIVAICYAIASTSIMGCGLTSPQESSAVVVLMIMSIGTNTTEHYIVNDATAYDLLTKKHTIDYKGELRCIDGVCGGSEYHWSMYINGSLAPKGAKYYVVRNGDQVEFALKRGGWDERVR